MRLTAQRMYPGDSSTRLNMLTFFDPVQPNVALCLLILFEALAMYGEEAVDETAIKTIPPISVTESPVQTPTPQP